MVEVVGMNKLVVAAEATIKTVPILAKQELRLRRNSKIGR